jgi:hypothetical protein
MDTNVSEENANDRGVMLTNADKDGMRGRQKGVGDRSKAFILRYLCLTVLELFASIRVQSRFYSYPFAVPIYKASHHGIV